MTGIFIESPIQTGYSEAEIQHKSGYFFRPLNGVGGFVEFNIDPEKWDVVPDPLFPDEADVILIYDRETGFPLDAAGVEAQFFDWKGMLL
jgi:hypothetical protein